MQVDPVLGHQQVNPFRSPDAGPLEVGSVGAALGQLLDLTGPHAGGVDHGVCIQLERATGLTAVSNHAADCAVGDDQLLHSGRGENAGSVCCRRPGNSDDQPSIVRLAVPVGDAAADDTGIEAGRQLVCAAGAEVPVRAMGVASPTGHEAVERYAEPGAQPFSPAPPDRVEELHGANEVRCQPAEQQPALGQRFGDETEFEALQVPQAPVDQLRRPA